MTDAPPHRITATFTAIISALRLAVGFACRPPLAGPLMYQPRRRLPDHLASRLHARLGRMIQEFAALVAQVVAFGVDAPTRPPRRKPAPRADAATPIAQESSGDSPGDTPENTPWGTAPAQPASPPRAPRPARLPGHRGWLLGVSSATAAAGSQLSHLFTDPEMLALLRASPQLVKMLGPICRMLGADLPAEFRPPPPDPAEPKPPRRRRRRLWRPPSRRSDMLTLVRMGTPLVRY